MNIDPSSSLMSNERGDCTVRAISKAFGVSYNTAHKWLKNSGRQDRSGFWLTNFFKIGNEFVLRSQLKSVIKYRSKKSRVLKGCRISFKSPKRKPTIPTFLKKNPTGTFVCCKSSHAFCIIDGVLYGQRLDHSRIQVYWKVSRLKSKPEPQHQIIPEDNKAA